MRVLNSTLLFSSFSRRSPHVLFLAAFLVLYFILIQYCRTHYDRDPTSAFFKREKGFARIYSDFRTSQATNFVRHIDAAAGIPHRVGSGSLSGTNNETSASLCVGIASIAREKVNYFEATVGSLLVDLTLEERDDIYLILFFPNTDPAVHPSYRSNWVNGTADQVLSYDVDKEKIEHLKNLEAGDGLFREKGLFDYVYLLKACQATGTPYAVVVEDDVVAMDGWYHRTKRALAQVEQRTRASDNPNSNYLYLRLFHTETFLGWNKEEWPTYLLFSILTVTIVYTILHLTRRYLLPSLSPSLSTPNLLPTTLITTITLLYTPLLISLFFLAGRISLFPPPSQPGGGIQPMPRFGCCSQALAFPHARLADLIAWYESKRVGFADMLLEEYADTNGEGRWAMTPSVFQHVGVVSSKGTTSDGAARVIWNFGFELNDPIALQREHRESAKHGSA